MGDILGQHQLLGFVESFSANFPCISCKAHRDACRQMIIEDGQLLRNPTNYNEDVVINDVSKTGINRPCPLNDLDNYHVTSNIIWDVMHDCLEGICKYGMADILAYIIDKKMISLSVINSSLIKFPFGKFGLNRPPPMKKNFLDKKDLAYSASEMKNLVLYFSLMIGEHIPKNDKVWEYYLVLKSLLSLLLLKKLTSEFVNLIDEKVTIHNEMYMNVFQKPLKPKFHHLIHYKRSILKSGPLCNNWSMRFESENRETKEFATVIKSRVNICKSICIRANYKMANNLIKWRSINSVEEMHISVGPIIMPTLDVLDKTCLSWAVVKGHKFVEGSIIVTDDVMGDIDVEILPQFCMVGAILQNVDNIEFLVLYLDTIEYDAHLDVFIAKTKPNDQYVVLNYNQISGPLVYTLKNSFYLIPNVGI